MELLSEDQSWNLLREKVFSHHERCPQELLTIGKKIAAKCGGLPLAIVLAAGLLNNARRTLPEWERFEESVRSTLASNEEKFLKIMSLSYDHLPYHLKPCFLYIGGFPEDYEIPVFKLLQLWIAEGFVKSTRSKSLEEVAEEYFEDLVRRNLVLITNKSAAENYPFCRIHDLLRDLCIQNAEDENFFYVDKHSVSSRETVDKRRLFLFHQKFNRVCKDVASFRSVIVYSQGWILFLGAIPSFLGASKLLKVFDGLDLVLNWFPTKFTKFPHLRYLSFTLFPSSRCVIPSSISRLRNLHTLILESRSPFSWLFDERFKERTFIYLPFEIWTMPQLRHLIVHNAFYFPNPISSRVGAKDSILRNVQGIFFDVIDPRAVAKVSILQNLQTLHRITDFRFDEDCVAMIPNLKKLGLVYTSWKSSAQWHQYCLHNLLYLHQLESLELIIDSKIKLNDFPVNFAFPPKLKKLDLCRCSFPWEKMTIIGSLSNLEVLKLRDHAFSGKEWVTVEGEFPQLKFLLMDSMMLVHWRTEHSHFPCLEQLVIMNCRELEEIPSEIGDIPSLQLIEIGLRNKSLVDSAKKIQKDQEDMGNDSLEVRFISDHRNPWLRYLSEVNDLCSEFLSSYVFVYL